MRPGERMHSPSLTSPGPNLRSTFTSQTHFLTVSWLPVALETHSLGRKGGLIGRDRKYKHHRRWRQVQLEMQRERTNKNRSCAQHARCVKMPDLLSGKSAWLCQIHKVGLTGVRQCACSRQEQAGSTWQAPRPLYTLSPCIQLAVLTPPAVFTSWFLCVVLGQIPKQQVAKTFKDRWGV